MRLLQNPESPPHSLYKVNDDSTAVRNDGEVLEPANENIWYILATIYGEQKFGQLDEELHRKNRRAWNGITCAKLSVEEREKLASHFDIKVEELSPLTEGHERELRQNIKARTNGKITEIPVIEPGMMDFSHIYFPHRLVARQFYFPDTISFSSSIFHDGLDFTKAWFSKSLQFRYSHLMGANIILNDVTFQKYVNFSKAIIATEINEFTGVEFEDFVFFDSVKFDSIYFTSSNFRKQAIFSKAHFNGSIRFKDVNFCGSANFEDITAHTKMSFQNTKFEGKTTFQNGQFLGPLVMLESYFSRHVPIFYQTKMHHDTVFSTQKNHWPPVSKDIAEQSKRAYTRLRQIMNTLQKDDDEHFFFRQEMAAKGFLEGPLYKVLSKLFKWTSDYGHSIGRPVSCFIAVTFLFSLIYYFGHWVELSQDIKEGAVDALGQSTANSFPFLGFQRLHYGPSFAATLPTYLKFLSGLQTVLSFVLFFLIGLGLSNRFRIP